MKSSRSCSTSSVVRPRAPVSGRRRGIPESHVKPSGTRLPPWWSCTIARLPVDRISSAMAASAGCDHPGKSQLSRKRSTNSCTCAAAVIVIPNPPCALIVNHLCSSALACRHHGLIRRRGEHEAIWHRWATQNVTVETESSRKSLTDRTSMPSFWRPTEPVRTGDSRFRTPLNVIVSPRFITCSPMISPLPTTSTKSGHDFQVGIKTPHDLHMGFIVEEIERAIHVCACHSNPRSCSRNHARWAIASLIDTAVVLRSVPLELNPRMVTVSMNINFMGAISDEVRRAKGGLPGRGAPSFSVPPRSQGPVGQGMCDGNTSTRYELPEIHLQFTRNELSSTRRHDFT